MNSRLSSARASASRRCQAGSILKKVNLAKVRSGAAMTMAMLVLATALPGTASAAGPRDPAVIVAGLLGSTLGRAGVPSRAAPDAGAAAVFGVNQGGRIDTSDRGCGSGAVERSVGSGRRQNRVCAGLTVLRTSVPGLRA